MAAGRQHHEAARQPQLQGRPRHPPGEQPPRAERRPSVRRVDASRRTAPSDRPAAASGWRRSSWATSRGCAGTSARTPTRASSSGGTAYYAQDTWRTNDKLTLNYGLRLDIINPQTVNEAGNGGFLDLTTGEIRVAGVGGIGLNGDIENRLNWAPRVGATYQIDSKTVIRGRIRPQLRSRRVRIAVRPQRDAEPAGALGAGAQRGRDEFRARLHACAGTAAAGFPNGPAERPVPAAQRRVRARASGQAAAADRRRVQRDRAAAVDRHDVGRGRVRRQPGQERVCRRRSRRSTSTSPRSSGSNVPRATAGRSSPAASPTTSASGGVRLDAGDRLLLQLREQRLRLAAGEVQQAVLGRLFGQGELHPAAGQVQESGVLRDCLPERQGLFDRTEQRAGRLGPQAQLRAVARGRVAGRPQSALPVDISPVADAILGGWQFNANHIMQSGLPFERQLPGRGRGPRHGADNRPNLIGDPSARKRGRSGSTQRRSARPEAPSADRRAGRSATWNATRCAALATGGRTRRCSSTSASLEGSSSSSALEAVNLFNHVNLGNPDSEVGVPGNNNTNAGRINFDRVRQRRSAAELPVRAEVHVLISSRLSASSFSTC